MVDFDVPELVEEILSALDAAGGMESWVQRRMDGSDDGAILDEAFLEVTQRLFLADPPRTTDWEHLPVATADRSARPNGLHAYEACKSAIAELTKMIEEDSFNNVAPERIVTFGSALTLVLIAQRRLRQPIEVAIGSWCEKFPGPIPDMAERCQDIWQRWGQMSGAAGLYLWDTRNNEWRLNKDFKPFRPT